MNQKYMNVQESLQENDKFKSIEIPFFIMVCILLLISYYFNGPREIYGHDAAYHMTRISVLADQIEMGIPFARINPTFLAGAGYASSLFYCDLFTYIPAVLNYLGIGLALSLEIYLFLLMILSYFTMRYCVYKMTGNRVIALLSAVLFTLAFYHLDCSYYRAALGEVQAFVFFPFVIYGLYDYLYNDFKNPLLMGIGFVGIMLSHAVSVVVICILYTITFLVNWKRVFKAEKLKKLFLTAGAVLLLTVWYGLPVLEMLQAVDLVVIYDQWASLSNNTSRLINILLIGDFRGVGPYLVITCLLAFSERKRISDHLKPIAKLYLLIGVITALSATDLLPWEYLERYLNIIQFPWRFLGISAAGLAIAGAIYLYYLYLENMDKVSLKKFLAAIGVFLIVMTLYHYYLTSFPMRNIGYAKDQSEVAAGEWLPLPAYDENYELELLKYTKKAIDDAGNEYEAVHVKDTIQVNIRAAGKEWIDVPKLYYKGYDAVLVDKNGAENTLRVTGEGMFGFCRVYLDDTSQGTLIVSYGNTLIQSLSMWASILCFAVIGIAFLYRRRSTQSKTCA